MPVLWLQWKQSAGQPKLFRLMPKARTVSQNMRELVAKVVAGQLLLPPLTSADVHWECDQHLHSGVISYPSEMLASYECFTKSHYFCTVIWYRFLLKFQNFWTSKTSLIDNIRLRGKKLICIPRKKRDGGRERCGQEAQLIPCQAHYRSHQATSPEEDLKAGKGRDLDGLRRNKCRKIGG